MSLGRYTLRVLNELRRWTLSLDNLCRHLCRAWQNCPQFGIDGNCWLLVAQWSWKRKMSLWSSHVYKSYGMRHRWCITGGVQYINVGPKIEDGWYIGMNSPIRRYDLKTNWIRPVFAMASALPFLRMPKEETVHRLRTSWFHSDKVSCRLDNRHVYSCRSARW